MVGIAARFQIWVLRNRKKENEGTLRFSLVKFTSIEINGIAITLLPPSIRIGNTIGLTWAVTLAAYYGATFTPCQTSVDWSGWMNDQTCQQVSRFSCKTWSSPPELWFGVRKMCKVPTNQPRQSKLFCWHWTADHLGWLTGQCSGPVSVAVVIYKVDNSNITLNNKNCGYDYNLQTLFACPSSWWRMEDWIDLSSLKWTGARTQHLTSGRLNLWLFIPKSCP